MLRDLSKKIIAMMCMLMVCTSCAKKDQYTIREYLKDLADISGISYSSSTDDVLRDLKEWGIIDEDDRRKLNRETTYDYLSVTICRLLEKDEESFEQLKNDGWFDRTISGSDPVTKEKGREYIRKATELINHPEIEDAFSASYNEDILELNRYVYEPGKVYTEKDLTEGDILFLENDGMYVRVKDRQDRFYSVEDAQMNEIYHDLRMAGDHEIDFSKARDYAYGDVAEEVNYLSTGLSLLSAAPQRVRKSFTTDGFDVSYSISSSSVSVRLTKNTGDSSSAFFDFTISNVHPSYDYVYEDGKLERAFFRVDYDTVDEIGATTGRYLRYIADFEDLDNSSFLKKMGSVIKKDIDEIEATVKICQIRTPLPNVPSAYLNIDLVARIYVSGKVELVLNNSHALGFEVKNSKLRLIADTDRDVDGVIGASSKAVMGINFNIEAGKVRLMDIEADAGLAASVSTTLHLYDDDGIDHKQESELPYSAVNDLSHASSDIKVCGDVSFNYVMDVTFNTSKTILYKLGLTAKNSILNKKNQVFHNLTHIEDNAFVKYCTRKDRFRKTGNSLSFSTDRISLKKYAVVVNKGNTYSIEPVGIPDGYSLNDLVYSSENSAVASLEGNIVKGNAMGSCKIKISTGDGKHSVEMSVLVSE